MRVIALSYRDPVTLVRRLGLLLALEGVALLVLGAVYGLLTVSAAGAPALVVAGSALLIGLLLLWLARAVSLGKRWARSPAVVINIFPLPLSLNALQSDQWWVAIPMLLLPGAVLYLFATPELRESFREGT